MKDISTQDLKGKRVLVRADLNIPIHNRQILDFARITLLKKTIDLLKNKGAKIILISHFGRPDGICDPQLSLQFLTSILSKHLGLPIEFGGNITDLHAVERSTNIPDASAVLFDNLRFYAAEETNDVDFAKRLASLGDVYVNEAFSCSHRKHASIDAITHYIASFPGIAFTEEMSALDLVLHSKDENVISIVGGKKISTKFPLLNNIANSSSQVIIGGAMANTILVGLGFYMADSFYEKNIIHSIKNSISPYINKLVLPEDFVCAHDDMSETAIHIPNSMPKHYKALDVGPASIKAFKAILNKASVILWNGPLGYYEDSKFNVGSIAIARHISYLTENKGVKSIVGGGDTLAAINDIPDLHFTYKSTAGGAFLEYLEGIPLPGVLALQRSLNVNA